MSESLADNNHAVNFSMLKPGMQRPRLDSASTVAPDSAAMSFSPSPCLSPQASIDAFEPLMESKFMLPAAEESDDEVSLPDPVSRVNSPPHKVPRLAGIDKPAETAQANHDGALETPEAATYTATEAPRTPRATALACCDTPPPMVPKSRLARPPLLQALRNQSLDEVRSVLLKDPEAGSEPFWDHGCEAPLCAAARLGCHSSIINILRDHGASLQDGLSPNLTARRPQPWNVNPPMTFELTLAHLISGSNQLPFQSSCVNLLKA